MRILQILAWATLSAQSQAFAATRTVTNLDDSGPGSLRAQIAAAASGDVIDFSVTGTIQITSATLNINKNLTITGPGMNALTLQCANSAVSSICSIESGTVTISDLRFLSATSRAISNGSNLTVNNALITGVSVNQGGGGIYSYETLRLWNCTFLNCLAEEGAAAVHIFSSSQNIIENCTFDGNRATGAGALAIYATFRGNVLTTVRYCTFVRNRGGSTIENEAWTFPGDDPDSTSNLVVENCTMVNNTGRAIRNSGQGYPKLTVRSCTIVQNQDSIPSITSGGGSPSFTLANTILKQDGTGPNLSIIGPYTSQGYNLCNDDGAGKLTGPGDKINMDPGLDPYGLLYHGGYTETIALVGDSRAIDQGKSFGLVQDQRGFPRPVDNPSIASAPGGDGSDIGAFETARQPRQSGFPSLIVTTTDDHDDGIASPGDTTLREAVRTANEIEPISAITFAPSVTGTLPLLGAISELVVSESLTITGPGARILTVRGGGNDRLLRVTNGTVIVSGLTLSNGKTGPGSASAQAIQGGGVHNSGILRFTDCAFTDHGVTGTGSSALGGLGGAGQGGAIYNGNFLRLEHCTFTRNQAIGGRGGAGLIGGTGGTGGGGEGGAVFNAAQGTLEIFNSTFQGNTAMGGIGGIAERGGTGGTASAAIYNLGSAIITNSTISGNVATGGSGGTTNSPDGRPGSKGSGIGGVFAVSGSAQLRNTLCAGNSVSTDPTRASPDVRGAFSGTFNLIGTADDSTGLTGGTGNQTGTEAAPLDPKLGPLQNNGGQTDTMSPGNGSPAIDAATQAENFDQIGTSRPLDSPAYPNAPGGNGSDIGAVEVDAPQPGPHFVVTTTADQDDGVASSLACSLREAIHASNAQPGPNTITFKSGLTGSMVLSLEMLTITDSVTITGAGARVMEVVGQSPHFRLLQVTGGTSSITGLTFRNGRRSGSPSGTPEYGGAIYNSATLTVTDCSFINNAANGSNSFSSADAGSSAGGGAIANMGTASLNLVRCTFADNAANGGGGGGFFTNVSDGGTARGGAVFSEALASVVIESCTFHNNTAAGGNEGGTSANGGSAFGGAIFSQGSFSVTSSTIHGNRALVGSGGGAVVRGAGVSSMGSGGMLRNTICAGNTGSGSSADVDGAFASGGHNLIGSADGSTGFVATGDQAGTNTSRLDPLLGPFANHGGSTDTKLSLAGSPVRDRGRSFGITHDQRGHLRIADSPVLANASAGDGTDIGATEYHPLGGPDTDGDGMSDEYEIFYGFDSGSASDAGMDTDGDGMSNAAEFTAATDPRNPGSRLRITSITHQGNNLRIEFGPAVVGRNYRLQRSRLLGEPWSNGGQFSVPVTGNAVMDSVGLFYTGSLNPFDPTPRTLLPTGFYRIQAIQPP